MAKIKRFEASNKKKDKFKSAQREESSLKERASTKYKMKYIDYETKFSAQYH